MHEIIILEDALLIEHPQGHQCAVTQIKMRTFEGNLVFFGANGAKICIAFDVRNGLHR